MILSRFRTFEGYYILMLEKPEESSLLKDSLLDPFQALVRVPSRGFDRNLLVMVPSTIDLKKKKRETGVIETPGK